MKWVKRGGGSTPLARRGLNVGGDLAARQMLFNAGERGAEFPGVLLEVSFGKDHSGRETATLIVGYDVFGEGIVRTLVQGCSEEDNTEAMTAANHRWRQRREGVEGLVASVDFTEVRGVNGRAKGVGVCVGEAKEFDVAEGSQRFAECGRESTLARGHTSLKRNRECGCAGEGPKARAKHVAR